MPKHHQESVFVAVKKPLSAHIFFSQEYRKQLKQEHPNLNTRQVQQ